MVFEWFFGRSHVFYLLYKVRNYWKKKTFNVVKKQLADRMPDDKITWLVIEWKLFIVNFQIFGRDIECYMTSVAHRFHLGTQFTFIDCILYLHDAPCFSLQLKFRGLRDPRCIIRFIVTPAFMIHIFKTHWLTRTTLLTVQIITENYVLHLHG